MGKTGIRHGYYTGTTPQIIVKILNHRIRAREKEEMKGEKMPIHTVATWARRQLLKVKVFLAMVLGIAVLVFLHAHERPTHHLVR